jgi:hypothetical protein
MARGGLCEVERARRLRDMLALGDGDKDTKLLKRHIELSIICAPLSNQSIFKIVSCETFIGKIGCSHAN